MLNNESFWEKMVKDALKNKAEYNFLDFKYKLSDKNDRLKEHINAFGNLERGGCFVFGVEDFMPKGLNNWDDITQKITNLAKNSQEPSLYVDVIPIDIEGVKLLGLHIQPSKIKPVFIKDRMPLGGDACFKRSGSSTVSMSIQEIRDLLSTESSSYFDQGSVLNASLEELDLDYLNEHVRNLDLNNVTSTKNISILLDNQILVGSPDFYNVSVAGWLCFAINPQKNKLLKNSYIEFHLFSGNARNIPIRKYEIKGCLPKQIEKSIEIIQQYIWTIPVFEKTKRKDVPAYSDIVLREVITNSLVHRDYQKMHQPVKISMFDDRIEIENPGGLLPGITIYNLIHKRDWRNPIIAELMTKFGLGEMDGQGIDRLYAGTLQIKVPPPKFINNENSFITILSAPKSFEEFSHDEKKFLIIIMIIMYSNIDNESIRKYFDISRDKASTLIKSLVSENIIQPLGASKKFAKYDLTEDYKVKIFS